MKTYIQARKLVLQRTPLILHIAKNNRGGKVGTAVIRGASFVWYPGNAKKGRRIHWSDLDQLFQHSVPKRRKRKQHGK